MKQIPFLTLLFLVLVSCGARENYFEKSWTSLDDRVWVGSEFWSNRLQDWKIQNGRLECIANIPRLKMRTTHLINCRLANKEGDFLGKVDVGAIQSSQNNDAACGFLLGAGPKLDVWGASLVQQKTGPGAGLFAGITAAGDLFVRDMESGKDLKLSTAKLSESNTLFIEVTNENSKYTLTLECGDEKLSLPDINKERLVGNIAIVSHPGTGDNPGSFWFNNLEVWGSKLIKLEETVGPVISTQYTLSNDILKMTAQMAPVSETDPREVSLEIKKEGSWQEISITKITVR